MGPVVGRPKTALHHVLGPMRGGNHPNNRIDGRVPAERIREDLPLVPGETVLPEPAGLSSVLRIVGIQQVASDFHIVHAREGSIRKLAHAVRSPACNVTTAWNGRSNSTS